MHGMWVLLSGIGISGRDPNETLAQARGFGNWELGLGFACSLLRQSVGIWDLGSWDWELVAAPSAVPRNSSGDWGIGNWDLVALGFCLADLGTAFGNWELGIENGNCLMNATNAKLLLEV